jgi:putative intracellular protease/amidase
VRCPIPVHCPLSIGGEIAKASDVVTAGGVALRAARWDECFDILVVPGFELRSPGHVGRALEQWRPEIAYIASAAAAGIPVASVCVGAFLLAISPLAVRPASPHDERNGRRGPAGATATRRRPASARSHR